jgi:hypothetical protein
MVVMAMMMVLRRGKRRGSNYRKQQGNEQKFLHALHRSTAPISGLQSFDEAGKNAHQDRNGECKMPRSKCSINVTGHAAWDIAAIAR